jgi:simple sugar transport system substrate-binding protein
MRNLCKLILLLAVVAAASTAYGQSAMPAAGDNLTVGLLLVGPYNDHGWSQAHFDAVQYVVNKVSGAQMIYLDKVNPADRPGTTASQLAESLVAKGAKLIIFSSDDMSDEAVKFAQAHSDIFAFARK